MAGGAGAGAFPQGLPPSWLVTSPAQLDSTMVSSCSECLRGPHWCPRESRSNTLAWRSPASRPAIPALSPLLINVHLALWLHSSLLPQPCEPLSTELCPPEQPSPVFELQLTCRDPAFPGYPSRRALPSLESPQRSPHRHQPWICTRALSLQPPQRCP